MEISEAVKTQEFVRKMRKEQANYVVSVTAPTIAEYFEELKYKENDKYKEMITDFVDELSNSEDINVMIETLKRYQNIVDDYRTRIEKIERGDKDIIVLECSNVERTKELLKPVELICGFIDNLIYGGYELEDIKIYCKSWQEKSEVNILEPSDYTVSKSGRHANLAYVEDENKKEDIQEK